MVWHLELGVLDLWRMRGTLLSPDMGWGVGGVEMVRLVISQHLGVKSSVGRSLSRSAVRREFVRIGDEGGGPSGYQMDRIHGGNISPARQFMRFYDQGAWGCGDRDVEQVQESEAAGAHTISSTL